MFETALQKRVKQRKVRIGDLQVHRDMQAF
jgi:hypothetical protein